MKVYKIVLKSSKLMFIPLPINHIQLKCVCVCVCVSTNWSV